MGGEVNILYMILFVCLVIFAVTSKSLYIKIIRHFELKRKNDELCKVIEKERKEE